MISDQVIGEGHWSLVIRSLVIGDQCNFRQLWAIFGPVYVIFGSCFNNYGTFLFHPWRALRCHCPGCAGCTHGEDGKCAENRLHALRNRPPETWRCQWCAPAARDAPPVRDAPARDAPVQDDVRREVQEFRDEVAALHTFACMLRMCDRVSWFRILTH